MRVRLALSIVTVWLCATSVFGQVIAVRAGQLVDPETGTSSANQIILIEAGVVTAVGPSVSIPDGAQVVDLSSATVMPGLFDAHTHLCMNVRPERDAGSDYLSPSFLPADNSLMASASRLCRVSSRFAESIQPIYILRWDGARLSKYFQALACLRSSARM